METISFYHTIFPKWEERRDNRFGKISSFLLRKRKAPTKRLHIMLSMIYGSWLRSSVFCTCVSGSYYIRICCKLWWKEEMCWSFSWTCEYDSIYGAAATLALYKEVENWLRMKLHQLVLGLEARLVLYPVDIYLYYILLQVLRVSKVTYISG